MRPMGPLNAEMLERGPARRGHEKVAGPVAARTGRGHRDAVARSRAARSGERAADCRGGLAEHHLEVGAVRAVTHADARVLPRHVEPQRAAGRAAIIEARSSARGRDGVEVDLDVVAGSRARRGRSMTFRCAVAGLRTRARDKRQARRAEDDLDSAGVAWLPPNADTPESGPKVTPDRSRLLGDQDRAPRSARSSRRSPPHSVRGFSHQSPFRPPTSA